MSSHPSRRITWQAGAVALAVTLWIGSPVFAATNCSCPDQARGDLNGDGAIDNLDVVLLACHLTQGDAAGTGAIGPAACADVTLDCKVDIQDLMVYLLYESQVLPGSHSGRFIAYEGSKTCLPCHEQEVLDVHGSDHYQWKGPTPEIVGREAGTAGKLGSINDFCTYPDINWIGQMTNVDGVVVDGGCARCHVGMGAKPAATATQAQLENIDCLLCHSDSYKRKVDSRDGTFKFVPDQARMPVNFLQAAYDIHVPGKDACLNCHTRAGGGNNFKRGDIEEAHRNPSRIFDVHMASTAQGGAGLICTDCHQVVNHAFSGRGSDLRVTETSTVVDCTMCHNTAPHSDSQLNAHLGRVSCTVCHIPAYAKVAPTDVRRDFSLPGVLDEATRLFEPAMTKASNVIPEYAFWNGKSFFYEFGTPAVPGRSGRVLMSGPDGAIADPEIKLYAFKHHTAVQAADLSTNRLIPLKMGILFQTGNSNQAIVTGANDVGWGYSGHTFVETERYMGLFHEVAPKEYAVGCNECHNGGTRIDFDALGYTPNAQYNGKPLCASCHEDKSGEWSASELFTQVHRKHVDDRHYNCNRCHVFSTATY